MCLIPPVQVSGGTQAEDLLWSAKQAVVGCPQHFMWLTAGRMDL